MATGQSQRSIFILVGPPGAGKGTVSPAIVDELAVPQLSTGDMLRAAITAGTETGRKAEELMSQGKLVPDEIVIGIIEDRMKEKDCDRGCILDGFPRTLTQACALEEMLAKTDDRVSRVVEFCVPDSVLTDRICGRWIHKASGRSYHTRHNPPRSYDGTSDPTPENMLDDETNEALYQRPDDTKDALPKRLEAYHNETEPILEHFASADAKVVCQLDCNRPIPDVKKDAVDIVCQLRSFMGDAAA